MVIRDGALSTGVSNQDEFFQSLVGLSGESQNFDGNGNYVRFATGGGDNTQATGPINGGGQPVRQLHQGSRWARARPGPRAPRRSSGPAPATSRSGPT